MKPLTVLSLFDGISCGRVALQRAGIPVAKYYASEVDPYAIKVTQKNYPDTIQLGDVKQVWARDLPKIELLIGGSPCQDLSIAKSNREGLKGARSGLFWHYVRLLRTTKPRWFLLENVASMSQADRDQITKILGVQPILINSALVSAQQRKRLYWTNIPNITHPEDRNILLRDILESGISYKDKSGSLVCKRGGISLEHDYKKAKNTLVVEAIPCSLRNRGSGKLPEFNGTNKANVLTTVSTDIMVCQSVLYNRYNQQVMPDKSAALGTNPQCPTSKTGQTVISITPGEKYIFVKDKKVCFTRKDRTTSEPYSINLPDGEYSIRKLTPIECERLQTLPDNYTEGISNSQRYKCIGNGWTVDVIAHIFSFIPKEDK